MSLKSWKVFHIIQVPENGFGLRKSSKLELKVLESSQM